MTDAAHLVLVLVDEVFPTAIVRVAYGVACCMKWQ